MHDEWCECEDCYNGHHDDYDECDCDECRPSPHDNNGTMYSCPSCGERNVYFEIVSETWACRCDNFSYLPVAFVLAPGEKEQVKI